MQVVEKTIWAGRTKIPEPGTEIENRLSRGPVVLIIIYFPTYYGGHTGDEENKNSATGSHPSHIAYSYAFLQSSRTFLIKLVSKK